MKVVMQFIKKFQNDLSYGHTYVHSFRLIELICIVIQGILSAESLGTVLGQGTKNPQAALCGRKQQKPQSNSRVVNFQTSFVKYLSDFWHNSKTALLKMAVTNLSGYLNWK